MIVSLVFSNFYSFKDKTHLSFAVGKKPASTDFDFYIKDQRINKAIAVVGANASGKTQFIKPLAFLRWFVCDSFLTKDPEDKQMPYYPHRLDLHSPTEIELDFFIKDVNYKYYLKLQDGSVLEESLYEKTSTKFSFLFKRERVDGGFVFKSKLPFPKKIAESIRDNVSLIGAAYNYDVKEMEVFVRFFSQIRTNVTCFGRRRVSFFQAAVKYHQDEKIKNMMVKALRQFDLGLEDVKIKEIEVLSDDEDKPQKRYMPMGVHKCEASGDVFELPFLEESNGTRSAFTMIDNILTVLSNGGIAVIDEIDEDLHPLLVPVILDWFSDQCINEKKSQLLFTCHTPQILDYFQKHQVYICEKYNLCSEAYRIDSLQGLRSDDNLYAKYLAGAIGGIPEV